jgi:hypothetical protein
LQIVDARAVDGDPTFFERCFERLGKPARRVSLNAQMNSQDSKEDTERELSSPTYAAGNGNLRTPPAIERNDWSGRGKSGA